MRAILTLLLLGLQGALPTPGKCQDLELFSLPGTQPLLPSPLVDPETSLRVLSELRRTIPESFDLHIAAVREALALGLVANTEGERRGWLDQAIEAARAALAVDSSRADAHYWLSAALGLQSNQVGIRAKISLAREAHLRAVRTLELDASHGGGHHALGRLHAGAKRLSWASRLVARGLGLGEVLNEASWESAEYHMRLGAELDPDQLAHLYEYGKFLVEARGRIDEGVAILQDVASREPRHEVDAYYSTRASRFLEKLKTR
jgi:tetratricopeptide (TPR) repeat protein